MNLFPLSSNFEINSDNLNKKQVAFKGTNIGNVNIIHNGKLKQAKIVKFDPNDALDITTLKNLSDYWNKIFPKKNSSAGYIRTIYDQFIRKNENFEFWALELPDSHENIIERILGFISFDKEFNKISPDRLIVRQDKSYKNPERNFKYLGSSLLYALCKYFKNTNFDKILLSSSNDPYYDHIKMPKLKEDDQYRFLDKLNIDRFIKNLEDSFNYNL